MWGGHNGDHETFSNCNILYLGHVDKYSLLCGVFPIAPDPQVTTVFQCQIISLGPH